jgi:protein-disulfide isomerase
MNKMIGAGGLALALALAGCDGDAGNNVAAPANTAGPITPIPAPNNGNWVEVVTQTPEGGFRMGNPDAPVKVVEYASMTCPHCQRFSAEASERLRNEYVRSGQVSFEFRNYVLNPLDAAVAMVARCQGPAAFFRLTEQLFAEQETWSAAVTQDESEQISQLPEAQQLAAYIQAADLGTFFGRRGVAQARISQCLANQQELQRMAQMRDVAVNQHRVEGTPNFLVNGELQDASTWEGLEPVIRQRIGG